MGAFTYDTGCTLPTSLISYWKLDETSGTRVDSFGTNDLTDNNTVTSGTGKVGNAGQFTLSNSEYLSHADNASLSTGDIDFTIACWFNPDSIAVNSCLMAKGVASVSFGDEYDLRLLSASSVRLTVNDGVSVSNTVEGGGPFSTGAWYFIVAWHDSVANTINIQVNNGGILSGAHSAGSYNSTGQFLIGAVPTTIPSSFWDGRIDEVGFWKKVLTSQERTDLYNNGNGNTYNSSGTCVPLRVKQMMSLFE